MRNGIRPRGAFTLLELIVVLTLISLLAALTISAIFRFREGQRETNTNTHLTKLQMEFEKQWRAKVELINKETPPADHRRVDERCLRKPGHGSGQGAPYEVAIAGRVSAELQRVERCHGYESQSAVSPHVYRVKPAFRTALRNSTAVELVPESQSAALLVLILSQGAGGSTTEADGIARTAMMDFPQTNNTLMQFRVFADEWGNPIGFRRWADDDMTDVFAELNQPPHVPIQSPIAPGGLLKTDPQDPEGRLQMPQQFWFTPQNGPNYRIQALALLVTPKLQNPFDGRNRGPFIMSAGKNGLYYIPPNGPFETDRDNLYSYRLARAGTGN